MLPSTLSALWLASPIITCTCLFKVYVRTRQCKNLMLHILLMLWNLFRAFILLILENVCYVVCRCLGSCCCCLMPLFIFVWPGMSKAKSKKPADSQPLLTFEMGNTTII